MIYLDNFEKIIVVLINLIGVWVAFSVYIANKNGKLNQWFAVMSFLVIMWVDFAYLGYQTRDPFLSTIYYRINWSWVSLFLVAFFYFYAIYFLNKSGRYHALGKIIAILGIILAFFSAFTDTVIKSTIIRDWGSEIIFGPVNDIFNLYSLAVALLILGLLISQYIKYPKERKSKVVYFLIGTFLFVFLNIIFNIVSPIVTGTVAYQHFGDYSAIFLLAFTAYAIVKQQLFGIRVVLTSLLVGFIILLLSLDIFIFTDLPILQFFKSIALITFLYLGRDLIRSVVKEEERLKKIKKLNEDLKEANDSLQELIKMKNSFLHIVSHQLRTPLTAMRGFISMWQEGDFDSYSPRKMNEIKKRISNNTERLNNLVNDMVVAMESEGGMKLSFAPVDVEEVLKTNIEFMKSNYENKKLYLHYRSSGKTLPKIEADPKYLGNAFMNLIDNAEKYTPKGGLNITVAQEGDNIKITFIDTGVGIKSEEKKMLFKKFSRGSKSSLINPNGSGLGLYIIKQIIKLHHGHIELASEGEGKGTTFTVTLPVKQPVLAKAASSDGQTTENKAIGAVKDLPPQAS